MFNPCVFFGSVFFCCFHCHLGPTCRSPVVPCAGRWLPREKLGLVFNLAQFLADPDDCLCVSAWQTYHRHTSLVVRGGFSRELGRLCGVSAGSLRISVYHRGCHQPHSQPRAQPSITPLQGAPVRVYRRRRTIAWREQRLPASGQVCEPATPCIPVGVLVEIKRS